MLGALLGLAGYGALNVGAYFVTAGMDKDADKKGKKVSPLSILLSIVFLPAGIIKSIFPPIGSLRFNAKKKNKTKLDKAKEKLDEQLKNNDVKKDVHLSIKKEVSFEKALNNRDYAGMIAAVNPGIDSFTKGVLADQFGKWVNRYRVDLSSYTVEEVRLQISNLFNTTKDIKFNTVNGTASMNSLELLERKTKENKRLQENRDVALNLREELKLADIKDEETRKAIDDLISKAHEEFFVNRRLQMTDIALNNYFGELIREAAKGVTLKSGGLDAYIASVENSIKQNTLLLEEVVKHKDIVEDYKCDSNYKFDALMLELKENYFGDYKLEDIAKFLDEDMVNSITNQDYDKAKTNSTNTLSEVENISANLKDLAKLTSVEKYREAVKNDPTIDTVALATTLGLTEKEVKAINGVSDDKVLNEMYSEEFLNDEEVMELLKKALNNPESLKQAIAFTKEYFEEKKDKYPEIDPSELELKDVQGSDVMKTLVLCASSFIMEERIEAAEYLKNEKTILKGLIEIKYEEIPEGKEKEEAKKLEDYNKEIDEVKTIEELENLHQEIFKYYEEIKTFAVLKGVVLEGFQAKIDEHKDNWTEVALEEAKRILTEELKPAVEKAVNEEEVKNLESDGFLKLVDLGNIEAIKGWSIEEIEKKLHYAKSDLEDKMENPEEAISKVEDFVKVAKENIEATLDKDAAEMYKQDALTVIENMVIDAIKNKEDVKDLSSLIQSALSLFDMEVKDAIEFGDWTKVALEEAKKIRNEELVEALNKAKTEKEIELAEKESSLKLKKLDEIEVLKKVAKNQIKAILEQKENELFENKEVSKEDFYDIQNKMIELVKISSENINGTLVEEEVEGYKNDIIAEIERQIGLSLAEIEAKKNKEELKNQEEVEEEKKEEDVSTDEYKDTGTEEPKKGGETDTTDPNKKGLKPQPEKEKIDPTTPKDEEHKVSIEKEKRAAKSAITNKLNEVLKTYKNVGLDSNVVINISDLLMDKAESSKSRIDAYPGMIKNSAYSDVVARINNIKAQCIDFLEKNKYVVSKDDKYKEEPQKEPELETISEVDPKNEDPQKEPKADGEKDTSSKSKKKKKSTKKEKEVDPQTDDPKKDGESDTTNPNKKEESVDKNKTSKEDPKIEDPKVDGEKETTNPNKNGEKTDKEKTDEVVKNTNHRVVFQISKKAGRVELYKITAKNKENKKTGEKYTEVTYLSKEGQKTVIKLTGDKYIADLNDVVRDQENLERLGKVQNLIENELKLSFEKGVNNLIQPKR